MNNKTKIILLVIITLGLTLRLIGLNWDQGQHLHPDERFLTMVLTDIKLPSSLKNYLEPNLSTLNPYNNNYSFFVYGSFPINFIKVLGEIFKLNSYNQIYLVGRWVTIILDSLVIFLVFLITKEITSKKTALIASFLYSISVLPIQLSHFFTVDPFLNFFLVLGFYFIISFKKSKYKFKNNFLLSLCFGLALASKITALYFIPIVFIFYLLSFNKDIKSFLKHGFILIFFSLLFFRFFQPQTFSTSNYLNWQPNPQFISNLKELKTWDKNPAFPPAIQWLKTTPIIFPLKNIVLWGLGFPYGILFIFSFLSIKKSYKSVNKKLYFGVIWFWILFLFFYQGLQSVTTMRYFLPIYPFIAIVTAICIDLIITRNRVLYLLFLLLLVYPLIFISIFLKPHSRVTASKWIYKNIPSGSTIATEYWDDPLPLSLNDYYSQNYKNIELHIADLEDDQKIIKLIDQLNQSDYYILSSNRFYKPIPQNYEIFPETSKFYQSLFDGNLGFKKVAEFTTYPCFFNICLNDDSAEEAFTVYDHPKVLIFQKL